MVHWPGDGNYPRRHDPGLPVAHPWEGIHMAEGEGHSYGSPCGCPYEGAGQTGWKKLQDHTRHKRSN